MVFGVKGPKTMLAHSIADALADYFEVDPKEIESRLMTDAQIVLRNARLRQQTVTLPQSIATVTGVVDNVTFKWSWTIPNKNSDEWVKDAVLTSQGWNFKVRLDPHAETGSGGPKHADAKDTEQANVEIPLEEMEQKVEEDVETDAKNTREQVEEDKLTKKEGRIKLYFDRQVQSVIDSLTLDLKDFELTFEMPVVSNKGNRTIAIVVGGKSIELLSGLQPPTASTTDNDQQKSTDTLEQRLTLSSLAANVVISAGDGDVSCSRKQVSYTLLEPFSYSATVSRLSGKRFDGVMTGLKVVGRPIASAVEAILATGIDKGLVLHAGAVLVLNAGAVQLQALRQLTGMILTPSPEKPSDSYNVKESAIIDPNEDTPVKKNAPDEAESKGGELDLSGDEKETENDTAKESKDGSVEEENAPEEPESQRADIDLSGVERQTGGDTEWTPKATPSTFEVPISTLSIALMEGRTLVASGVTVEYKADGTLLNMEVKRIELASAPDSDEPDVKAAVSGIRCRMLPEMTLNIDAIETLLVPGVVELTKELQSPSISFIGDATFIDITSTVEATVLNESKTKKVTTSSATTTPTQSTEADTTSAANEGSAEAKASASSDGDKSTRQEDKEATRSTESAPNDERTVVPFPMRISLSELKLKMARDNSLMQLSDLLLAAKPQHTADFVGTAVAGQLGGFKNELLQFQNARASALLPRDSPNEMIGFNLDADSVHVRSGYSTDEWSEKFEPSEKEQKRRSKGPTKMPFASVAELTIRIAYKGTGVAVKDTAVVVRPFHGNADTTSKDIIQYYTRACIGRVSGFISNAEVLGQNVVETTALTTAAWAGLGSAGAVVAVAGLDAAKGILKVGKESRDVSGDDKYTPGDFIRGALNTPGAIAKHGARRRGKEDDEQGNVADLAVGAACGAREYAVENRVKLGAAGGAGMGVLYGTLLGGPIGGVVGGVVAGAVTGKAIEEFDDTVGNKANEIIEGDLANTSFFQNECSEHDGHDPDASGLNGTCSTSCSKVGN